MAKELTQKAHPLGWFATGRIDAWWVGPLLTALGFGGFIVYTTFRVFYNKDYLVETAGSAHILSPFYSPLLFRDYLEANFPRWFSPAIFILWVPAGFRTTCYYYRKAYYRAYLIDPPGCAVAEKRHDYRGETMLFLFQNLHRYTMYLAVVIMFVLAWDVILACMWPTEDGGTTFGISPATIVMAINVVLLSLYTFGCHSVRHLIGGKLDCYTCTGSGRTRHKLWRIVSSLNERHMLWAWCSLFTVGFTDFYIWMVASERIPNPAILF